MRLSAFTTAFLLSVAFGWISSAQVPPGTGAGGDGAFDDQNFRIVLETLSPHQAAGCVASATHCPSSSAPALIVTKLAGWAPQFAGTQWIAPHPDQSASLRNGSHFGSVTYQTQFSAAPELTLNARVLADDSVVVRLNGRKVFSSSGEQHLVSAMFQLTGFISGMNTVTFEVSNDSGGPTGLDVAFSNAAARPSGPALALQHPASPDAMTFSPTAVGATSAQTLYVINNGDTIATFAAIGPATGSFSIDSKTQGCGSPLAPGEYCTFNVVFAPSSTSPASQTGTLEISLRGGPNSLPYRLNLNGTAAPVSAGGLPSLVYSPTSLVFPATPNGFASAEQIVKITNNGAGDAIFSDIYIPSNFVIDWKPPTTLTPACSQKLDDPRNPTLTPGASCAVGITFTPTTAPPKFIADAGMNLAIDMMCPLPCEGTLYKLPLSGTAGNGPVLSFSPNPLVFPTTPAGSSSAPINVTVTNKGNAAATISSLPASTLFALGTNTCAPSIAASATCTLPFTFNPPSAVAVGSVLTADSTATPPNPLNVVVKEGPATFSLNASGAVSAPANGPAATPDTNPMIFRQRPGVSATQVLGIRNTGNAPLLISSFSGGDTSGFSTGATTSDCLSGPLAPGDHCNVSVTFTPDHIGSVQASLVIHDNATPPQQTVTLSGVGLGPAVSLDNTTLVLLGTVTNPSLPKPVVLTNTGTDDLHISGVTVNGDLKSFVKTNDNCSNKTVPAQGTCNVLFSFNPAIVGPSQTTVTFTDDAAPSTQTVTLLGGISGPAILVTPPGTLLTFPTITGTPLSTTITLINAGSVGVTIQNVKVNTAGNGFTVTNFESCFGRLLAAADPGQLGGTCTFTVNFNRDSAGTSPDSIVVTTDPLLNISITVSGIAVDPAPPKSVSQTGARRLLSLNAAPDPVDGATGQFYEDELDLSLGGPLDLKFVRYYASGLSAGGYRSSLGLNWMSNFDIGMAVNDTTAQVLLFRGKIVNFSKAGNSWTLQSPTDVGYQFATAGTTYQFMDPVSGLVYTFNGSGKVTGIADGKGNTLTIIQGANGPTSIADGLGRTLSLTYAGSQLTSVRDQAGRSVAYSYTGNNLTSATDALKKTTQYTYTTAGTIAGLMTKKQLPDGTIPTVQTYDGSGKVVTQTDANGNATQIAYDGKGGTTITGALGDVTQQGNNASGDLGQMTDPMGNALNVGFDNAQRRASVTDKMGKTVQFTYHAPTGNIASRTNELGNTTSYSYTARTKAGFTFYDLTGIAFPDGTSHSLSYDANGNLISRTAADGTTATKTYDNQGRVVTATDANKQSTTFAYNTDSTLASRKDPLGNTTTYAYTNAGQVSKINDSNGGVSALTYDANGRPLTFTDAVGGTVAIQYDDDGRQAAITNQDGGIFRYTYTPTGKVASIADPLGNQTVFSYDAEDRLTSATDAAGETFARTYDSAGRLLALSDNNGPLMSYTYDAEGHILSQTDPTGKVTSFGYDPTGQLIGTTKADGSKYTFAYDKMGRLLSLANPLGETRSMTRDAMGRVTKVTLPGGLSSTVQFDALGRTAAITSPNGNTWAMSHDALGRISGITDPLGKATTNSYTGTQLTKVTFPLGTLTFTRDKAGRVTQRQYSDGTTIKTAYDPMSFITSTDGVTVQRDKMGHMLNVNGIALTYTAAGRMASVTYAPGKTVAYAYDSAGRLSTISDWLGGQTTFAYDAASRLAGMTYPNGIATTYSLDANGRLSGIAAGSLYAIVLTRDADGKIIAADRSPAAGPALVGSSQQFSYNAAGQMNGEKFDAMGRALTESGRTYTWDLASRLTGFQDSAGSATLTYDGLGQLASITAAGTARTFVFNPATRYPALSIVRQGASDLRYYVYTPGGAPLYSIEAGGNARKFYHFDEMGNTTLLTGDDGAVTDTYAITPYGDVADHTGTTDNPFTWQGQYGIIQETQGLYYMRQRHYDASAARFLSPDPLLTPDPRSAEPYTYARGNPLFFVDPSGALTEAQISDFQIQLRALDNEVPNLDVVEQALNFSDPNQREMERLVQAHPGVDWSGLHMFADDYHALNPTGPTNSSALATCLKLGTCDPRLTAGLTALVAQGKGASVEQSAIAIIDTGTANAILNRGGAIVSRDGAGLIHQDGSGLINQDGSGLIHQDGAGVLANDGATLIGHDGSSLIHQDGSGLIHQDGSGLINQDGSGLINQDGSGFLGGRPL